MTASDLDLNLLRVFMAIFRNGNITKAAEELSVTQSSVSQSLSKLRVYFDDPLFIKISTGVKPTPTAIDLAAPSENILDIAKHSFSKRGSFEPATCNRTIVICVSGIGELVIIPRLLKKLKEVAPLCKLRTVSLTDADISNAMKNGDIDITITGEIQAGDEIFQQRLFNDQLTPAVHIHSDLPNTITLEDFKKLDLIVPQENRNQSPILFDFLNSHGILDHVIYFSGSRSILPMAVAQYSDAACIIPGAAATIYQELGVVRKLNTDFELPNMRICQYWHRINAHSQYMQWLRKLIYETICENPLQ